ncbi:MAG: TAXI family TRAP transporter solute-binding subunit [Rhodospirillales bacterium]|nr:TAXI family TRAP transporter solute-binding subunit [Rhodospirillales bacterium]
MKLKYCFVSMAVCLAVYLSVWSWPDAQAAEQRFITIGTGGVTGVYYPTGGAICRLVNKGRRDHGIRCSVESTHGSAENIIGIRTGDYDFGLAQSDVQISALKGEDEFLKFGPYGDLRALFSVHSELMQIVARADSAIKTFQDLKGKRINIGNLGSGQRSATELILAYHGWMKATFPKIGELHSAEQSKALCDNQLDAIFFTAGIPNASVKEATLSCDTVLVPMDGAWVNDFLTLHPAYAQGVIAGGTYRGTSIDTPTFGPKAVVLTSVNMPDEVAYQIVKSVFENFEDFKNLHPAFAHLTKEAMVKDGLSAPLHPGALRYYQEVGLLP